MMWEDYVSEPYPLSGECVGCGRFTENYSELNEKTCEECGEDLIVETNIEGQDCRVCGKAFDMWEDYHESKDGTKYCCIQCYEELQEED